MPKECNIPPEVLALQRRQKELEGRLKFVEARLGIIRPDIIEELEDGKEDKHDAA